jgi:hypothetical protein
VSEHAFANDPQISRGLQSNPPDMRDTGRVRHRLQAQKTKGDDVPMARSDRT